MSHEKAKRATIQILTDFTGIFKWTGNTRGKHFEKPAETEQFRKALELFSTANTYIFTHTFLAND